MSYFPFTLRLFLLAVLVLLFDSALTFVLAHHCGPSQPLPEFPRHSCRTHTQTWQPGESIDNHPGGAPGRGSAPAQGAGSGQGTSVHCQLINGKCVCGSIGYTGRNIPCRPEFTSQPQTQPAEPQSCPIEEVSGASPSGLPYAANQSQSDLPGNQPRPLRRGDLLRGAGQAELRRYSDDLTAYVHSKFIYPPGIQPYNSRIADQQFYDMNSGRTYSRPQYYKYLLRTRVNFKIERCPGDQGDSYRVKDITTDNSAAFQLDNNYRWMQVSLPAGFEQFNKNAVQAAKSLNTGAGRQLLPFPSSYSSYTTVPVSVHLKNWDSHDLPPAARGRGEDTP